MQHSDTGIKTQAVGRITSPPELGRTLNGVPVCRFTISAETGPASSPVVKPIYVFGMRDGEPDAYLSDLAKRCGRGLSVGDMVFVPGVERQRTRRSGAIEQSILAADVKLRERAGTKGGGA